MRNDAKFLIDKYGGIVKLRKALEFQDQYEFLINNARNLLCDLETLTKTYKKILLNNNARMYKQLCDFKEMSIDHNKTNILSQLIKNFDGIHDNF